MKSIICSLNFEFFWPLLRKFHKIHRMHQIANKMAQDHEDSLHEPGLNQ